MILTITFAYLFYNDAYLNCKFKQSDLKAKGHNTELFLTQTEELKNRLEGHKNSILFLRRYLNHITKGDYLKSENKRPWLREDWNNEK